MNKLLTNFMACQFIMKVSYLSYKFSSCNSCFAKHSVICGTMFKLAHKSWSKKPGAVFVGCAIPLIILELAGLRSFLYDTSSIAKPLVRESEQKLLLKVYLSFSRKAIIKACNLSKHFQNSISKSLKDCYLDTQNKFSEQSIAKRVL